MGSFGSDARIRLDPRLWCGEMPGSPPRTATVGVLRVAPSEKPATSENAQLGREGYDGQSTKGDKSIHQSMNRRTEMPSEPCKRTKPFYSCSPYMQYAAHMYSSLIATVAILSGYIETSEQCGNA